MTKRVTHELTYDAPLEQVRAMLFDPAFREEVCARQHVVRAEATVSESGGVTQMHIDQLQDASSMPSFAKKFIGDRINIVQTEKWATPDRGVIEVEIPGKPGDIHGTITLAESGGVTTETVTMEAKVAIPLVGGKVEQLICDMMLKALKSENQVGRDYLSR